MGAAAAPKKALTQAYRLPLLTPGHCSRNKCKSPAAAVWQSRDGSRRELCTVHLELAETDGQL